MLSDRVTSWLRLDRSRVDLVSGWHLLCFDHELLEKTQISLVFFEVVIAAVVPHHKGLLLRRVLVGKELLQLALQALGSHAVSLDLPIHLAELVLSWPERLALGGLRLGLGHSRGDPVKVPRWLAEIHPGNRVERW